MHVYPNRSLAISSQEGCVISVDRRNRKRVSRLEASSDVMLFHPDWNAQFELHVDTSELGRGAMLAQEKDGVLRPVRFAS